MISWKVVKVMAGLCSGTAETYPCSPENEFGVTFMVAFNVSESTGHLTLGDKAGINNGQLVSIAVKVPVFL